MRLTSINAKIDAKPQLIIHLTWLDFTSLSNLKRITIDCQAFAQNCRLKLEKWRISER